MPNRPFFGILNDTTIGRLDMNKQRLSTISLITISSTLFGLTIGCEPPADGQSSVELPAEVVEAKTDASAPESAPSTIKENPAVKPSSTSDLQRVGGTLPESKKPAVPNTTPPNISKAKTDPVTPTEPAVVLPQAIEASPAILDLGTFSTSEKSTGTVKLTNIADEPVTVISARASCGCTTSDFKKNTVLNPGESTDITITMDGKGKARKLSKTVTFTIDGRPPLRLAVNGQTISFVNLDVDPLVIDDETGSSTVTLTSTDGQPFKILSILPAIVANISEEASPTQELILDWDAFWDVVRTTKVTIRMDHPLCKEITTNVRLTAEQRKRLNDIIKTRRAGEDLPAKDPTRPLTGDQLTRYIKAGRGKQVITFIKDGKGKVDAVDRSGVALLSTAALEGDVPTMQALLALGAQLERVDRVNRTPLMHAAQSKNPAVLTILLDEGADIQSRDSLGNTPLAWASGFGTAAAVLTLVDAGADVNTVDNMLGYTPLLWASGFGESNSVSILLEAGADTEVRDIAEGRTPLMHAVRTGAVEGVELLIAAGADVNAIDNDKHTALHVGAAGNNVKIDKIKTLVESGADPNAKNSDGETALDIAKARTDEDGVEIANYLADHMKSD